MAVLYIGTYDIVDPEQFKKYPPLVMALLPKYGGVVLASDTQAFVVEGSRRTMNVTVPVKGSMTWTSCAPSDERNSCCKTSSTLRMMKSTSSTGV